MIKVKNLTKIFDGKKVLDNISFEVKSGETLAVVGFSGSGKSTVLKLICGLIEKDGGEIITSKGDIAMVFQYSALFDSLNVADNIAFALRERKELRDKYTEAQIEKIVTEKLALVGLKGIEEKFPSELSGGMQKRVSFARAIVTGPNSILYDEPTSGLDPISSTLIEDYIVRLKDETPSAPVQSEIATAPSTGSGCRVGKAALTPSTHGSRSSIVVTHQMSTIRRTADRVIMLYDGKIVFEGTPEAMLKGGNEYTKQFVSASLKGPMKMMS